MSTLAPLLTVALIWTVAVITPGPNFLMMLRTSATQSRAATLPAVAGIGVGTTIWGCAGFFGIHALFAAAPWLYLGFKVLGGLYLIFLGSRLLIRSARQGTASLEADSTGLAPLAAFRLGLATNLANPKSALFMASVFATAMPAHPTLGMGVAAIVLMSGISVTWYVAVTWLFTMPWMTRSYGRIRRPIDRLAGTIFVVFGIRLVCGR
jgi:threonine/homoserine/homoserine lactone efflux protein